MGGGVSNLRDLRDLKDVKDLKIIKQDVTTSLEQRLTDAASRGDAEAVRGMVGTWKFDASLLGRALLHTMDVEVARALVDAGAALDVASPWSPSGAKYTVLMHAVKEGNVELVRLLLQAGGDAGPERMRRDLARCVKTLAAFEPLSLDDVYLNILVVARHGVFGSWQAIEAVEVSRRLAEAAERARQREVEARRRREKSERWAEWRREQKSQRRVTF